METITLNAAWTVSNVKLLKKCKFARVCIRRDSENLNCISAFDLNSAFKHCGMPFINIREKSDRTDEQPCHFWILVDELKKALDFCAGKSPTLTFNYDCKQNTVQIIGDRIVNVKTEPGVDEFAPIYSLKPESKQYAVGLVNELPHVINSVGKDDARPEFTGVYFDGRYLVTTDGHRLSISNECCDKQYGEDEDIPSIIIPQDIANIIIELGKRQLTDESLTYSKEQGECLYSAKDIDLFFETVPGTFPNFTKVVPEKFNFEFSTQIDQWIKAITPAIKGMLVPIGRIDGGKGKLDITIHESRARKGRAKSDVELKFTVDIDGDVSGMVFGCDMRYMLDALKSQFFAVKFQYIDQDSPVVIRGSNGIRVVMPVQI